MTITREDVTWAFRLQLDREPEDEDDGSVRSAVFAPGETPLPLA